MSAITKKLKTPASAPPSSASGNSWQGGARERGPGSSSAPYITIAMALTGIALLVASQFTPWCAMNVDTKIGIFPVSVNAEFYEGRIEYRGSSPFRNISISGDADFLGGRGNFDEGMGAIQGSSKNTAYTLTFHNRNSTADAKVFVKLHVANMPYWSVGMKQRCDVTVELNDSTNISWMNVDRLSIRLIVGDREALLVDDAVSGRLSAAQPTITYARDVVLSEDYGNFSIAATAELALIDSGGARSALNVSSFSQDSTPIKLKSVGQLTSARLVMAVAAYPLTLASIALAAAAAALFAMRKKGAFAILAAAASTGLLGALFYAAGMPALIELAGFAEYLSWSAGIYVNSAGAGLILAAVVAAWKKTPR